MVAEYLSEVLRPIGNVPAGLRANEPPTTASSDFTITMGRNGTGNGVSSFIRRCVLGEHGERLAGPEQWLLRLVLGGLWLHVGRCGPSCPAFVSHCVDAYGTEPHDV